MPTIRTLNAEVVGDTLNLQEQETDLATTPLAEVASDTSADYIIIVKDGAVRKVSVGELLAIEEAQREPLPYQSVSGSVTVPNETITEVCSYTIPTSGLWLAVSKASFTTSGTTVYNHYIFYGNEITAVRNNMHSGGGSVNVFLGYLNVGTVVSARVYQSTGDNRVCNADLRLVRLGNSPT